MSVEVKVPTLGESIVEATVGRWLKEEGDTVAEGDALVELETDKVNMEVASTAAGTLEAIVKPEGETVGIGDVLATVDESARAGSTVTEVRPAGEALDSPPQPPPERTPTGVGASEDVDSLEGVRATPLAKRVASEHGIDLASIEGTGPSGRVRREDVLARLQSPHATPAAPGSAGSSAPPRAETRPSAPQISIDSSQGRQEERIRMSRRRQTIARRLVEAQQTAAMLTTFNEVDMTAIMDIRRRRRDAFRERYGVNLGYMSFFTKAVVGGLKAFPLVNAEIQGDEIVIKHYYDIGIAVSAAEGLVVPIVRDADKLSFAEIERAVAALAQKARDQSLSLPELQGGTFTITNGGTFGSLLSTPILNTPQVGILGMHKIEERPIAVKGEVVIRPMMYVALSYDHRLIDGSEAVQFLVRVKGLLEDPETLLLEG
jgi:2-oxoglutarate dehydrogenase E2 component (dihydrolipoamide succinyltransferase)